MRCAWLSLAGLIILAAQAAGSQTHTDSAWIKDVQASSQKELTAGQAYRIVALDRTKTQALVRLVMGEKLHLSLAEYNAEQNLQAGQTTLQTSLPEVIVGTAEIPLADEDYRFILEAKLKSSNEKTKIMLAASPVYRAKKKVASTESNAIEVKVKSDANQIVSMGPIFVMPVLGRPTEFNTQPLPDAAKRAAKLVRSFMYYLDQSLTLESGQSTALKTEPK